MDLPFVEGGGNRRALRDYAAPNVAGTTSGIRGQLFKPITLR